MRHPFASCRRLAIALLLSWAAVATGTTFAQSPDPAAPSRGPAFRVEKLSITAPELAEVLGYRFFGYAWHFSTPTYVRLRVRHGSEEMGSVGNGHPPQSFVYEVYHSLTGPLSEVSVHLIEKQTDDGAPSPSEPRSEDVSLDFHLGLEGIGAGEGLPKPAADGMDAALAALLPKNLVDQSDYTQSQGYTDSMDVEKRHGQEYRVIRRTGSATLAEIFSRTNTVASLLDKPDAAQAAAALKTKWDAETEAKLLKEPTQVYDYRGEVFDPKTRQVKSRYVYMLTLECSREPFKDHLKDEEEESPTNPVNGGTAVPTSSSAASPSE